LSPSLQFWKVSQLVIDEVQVRKLKQPDAAHCSRRKERPGTNFTPMPLAGKAARRKLPTHVGQFVAWKHRP
jgi:hypothetical protein